MGFIDRPAGERLAIRYCASHGIPMSVFLGRWTAEDREVALEWQLYEDSKCPGCGQPIDECMADVEVSPKYEGKSRRCHACDVARITAQESDAGEPSTLYTSVWKVA